MGRIANLIVFSFIALKSFGQATPQQITLGESIFDAREILTDLVIPWDLVWKDDWLWFTEKRGNVLRVSPNDKRLEFIAEIEDVYVSPKENAGMHSMCFHPNWPDSSYLFIHYINSASTSKLVRYSFDQKKHTLSEDRIIFDNLVAARSHNGSRLTIDDKGNILFAIGDAYLFEPAQQLDHLNGKVLRFTPWGSVPEDNPFPNNYVWSYGHRNPQGLVFASNGKLYESEHGPTTDDEINLIKKGENYGWPKVNGYCDLPSEKAFCTRKNVVEPLWAFTPTAAPAGLNYYDSDYFPEFKNSLQQCFLKGRALAVLPLTESGDSIKSIQTYFENDYYRIRDVEYNDSGIIYIATSNREVNKPVTRQNDDKIIQISHLDETAISAFDFKVEGNTLAVSYHNDITPADIRITTFYGGDIVTEHLSTYEEKTLTHTFEKAGVYWLKVMKEGRVLTRLIQVK